MTARYRQITTSFRATIADFSVACKRRHRCFNISALSAIDTRPPRQPEVIIGVAVPKISAAIARPIIFHDRPPAHAIDARNLQPYKCYWKDDACADFSHHFLKFSPPTRPGFTQPFQHYAQPFSPRLAMDHQNSSKRRPTPTPTFSSFPPTTTAFPRNYARKMTYAYRHSPKALSHRRRRRRGLRIRHRFHPSCHISARRSVCRRHFSRGAHASPILRPAMMIYAAEIPSTWR